MGPSGGGGGCALHRPCHGDPELVPGGRSDDAVDAEAAILLKGLHGRVGLGAELAIGSAGVEAQLAEAFLEARDGIARVAVFHSGPSSTFLGRGWGGRSRRCRRGCWCGRWRGSRRGRSGSRLSKRRERLDQAFLGVAKSIAIVGYWG
jgi:hypothetical protein